MGNQNKLNTEPLWSLFNNLLLFTILCVVGVALFVPFQSHVNEWRMKQQSDKEMTARIADRAKSYDAGPKIVDGLDVQTGMVYDENFKLVKAACTSCHSSKLIIQNRATREGWKDMIVWMQETQGLPPLGIMEPKILDYLSTHYAPQNIGRRSNLDIEAIEWYVLKAE